MKVCIDARSPGYSGVRNYAACLLRELARLSGDIQYVLLRSPVDTAWNIAGIEERVIPTKNPLGWYAWSNTALPRMLDREGFDLYHSLKHITFLRGDTPKIVTFHSARFLIHPEHYKWHDATYWKVMSPIAARRYDAIIAVSKAEKSNYVERMGANPDKLHVTRLASDNRFRVIDEQEQLDSVRARFQLPERFILYVGRQVPVKNLETMLRGFAQARKQGCQHSLVLVGGETSYTSSLRSLASSLRIADHVLFTGPIFKELPEVYNLADLFLLMSHYESFGAVVLEAMASGIPIICSDRGGLPEVVGDAGAVVPAEDPAALADRICQMLSSDELREEFRGRGLARCKQFSWAQCAQETMAVYRIVKENKRVKAD